MTKNHALKRLLEHGDLTYPEMREITGWEDRQLWKTIQRLIDKEVVIAKGKRNKFTYGVTK